jgi:1-acyl-sn-glycerol-3-phosphate acyltransferase
MMAILTSLFDRSGNIPHLCGRLWGKMTLWASNVRVIVHGLDNIDPQRTYIFAANHQSWYDILALLGHLPVQFRWLAKKSLFKIPIFGWSMHCVGYIPVDRSNPREGLKSLKRAALRVKQGKSIVIFPEGTRTPDGEVKSFKTGGFILAIKSEQPIVPVSISGSYMVLARGSRRVRSGEIRIALDIPIETSSYSSGQKGELMERVRKVVVENFSKMREA